MAKWTPKQIAAGFGGKRAQTAAKKRRGRKQTTMAKKKSGKRRSGGGGGGKRRRRSGGGKSGGLSLSRRDTLIALGAAAGYGFIASQAEEGKEWAKNVYSKPPVIKPIGRAGTWAVAAYAAAKLKIAPKYTKPIAIGLAAVALVNLGRRGFKLYETDDEARSTMMAGEDGQSVLEGDVHLDAEYQEAA